MEVYAIITVLFILIIIISVYMLISYRRQIRDICRQVSFIRNHDTNMQAASDIISSKDIISLTEEINKLNEEAKRKIAEYGKKDLLLRETITSLSHDIRTPLTSLSGYIQLLSETEDEEERKRYMGIILERIGSLKDIFEDLFTYTKLQENAYRLDMESENVTQLVFDSVVAFYEEFNRENINININLIEEPVFVLCNKTAMSRIFQNIIKNSMVHCKSDVSVFLKKENGRVVFLCRNNIKDNDIIDIDKIFERFYKADTARSINSTGLGLAIAKGLTMAMNGDIEASLDENIFEIKVSFKILI